jgi:predicted nucleic acid-binding protein
MKVIVADASPLNYLIRIDHTNVLPSLFDEVFAPTAVIRELSSASTPQVVRDWISAAPTWLKISSVSGEGEPIGRGAGERAVIELAITIGCDLVLIDDLAARAVASDEASMSSALSAYLSGPPRVG